MEIKKPNIKVNSNKDHTHPLVSICMITYNHEKYIKQSIDSIIAQKTDFNFEVIIGEDYSTDKTRDIVLKYYKSYPGIIKLNLPDKNIGMIQNLFSTLSVCSGKYIAFCEGDDYWIDSYKLQKQIDFLENNPEYGMVHTDADYLYQNTGEIIQDFNKTKQNKIPDKNIFNKLFQANFLIHTASVCIKKSILETHFDYSTIKEKDWGLCDLALWFEISRHSKVKYFNDSTVVYRLLEKSASRTTDYRKQYEFHKSVNSVRLYYWKKYSRDMEIKKMMDRNFKITQIGDAFNLNDKGMAKEAYNFLKTNKLKTPYIKKLLYFSFHVFFLSSLIKFIKRINNKRKVFNE